MDTTVTLIMKFIISHFLLDTDWILIFTMYIAYKVFCKIILNSKYTASDFGKNPESNRKIYRYTVEIPQVDRSQQVLIIDSIFRNHLE